ncbi:hypothetical protein D3C71_1029410 [compost metagenome]
MAPDRVAPAVADGGAFDHVFLVDLDAQTRAVRDLHEALVVVEHPWVFDVVEQVVALVVMDAQALFLDERVVASRVQLQARRQGNRAQRAMQRQRHVVGFGHVGDLAGFGDAAGVGCIRLDDVDVAFAEHTLEIPAREKALAQSNRRAGQRRQLLQRFVVFAEHRLFDEHQFVRIKLLHQHLGHRLVHPAMEVHADADIRADRVTHGGDVGQGQVDFFEGVEELQLFGAVHFHCGETTADRFFRCPRGVCRTVATDPRIHADLVPHLTTQQIADRNAQRLALDVPQRLVDTGQGAHVDRAATVEAAAIEHGPDVFDVARVFADQVVGQFLNGSGDSVGAAFDHGLAPTGHALVGFDLEEAPARRNDEGGQLGDFHLIVSLVRCSARSAKKVLAKGFPGSDVGLGIGRHLLRCHARFEQARAEAEALDARVDEYLHVVRGDPADRRQNRSDRQHRQPGFDDCWPHLLGREHLQYVRTFGQCREGFGRRGDTRRQIQPRRFRCAQDLRIAMGHDDHLTARLFHLLDLLRSQHRSRADQAIGGQGIAQDADTFVRQRRVERYFDNAKSCRVQDFSDGGGLFGMQATQDRDQTVLRQCLFEHVRTPVRFNGMKGARSGRRPAPVATTHARWPARPRSLGQNRKRRGRGCNVCRAGNCR